MGNKLFDQVGGTIKVALKGKNQEKIINMASSRGIYIWDIKKNGDDLNFKVRTSGLKALQSISEENDYELDVREKQGLPFYRNLFRRRMGFFTGALIFILALYIMSSFVWFVEVDGNKKVESSKILLTAAKHGVYQGAAKWNFSRIEAEEAMLRDLGELSYVKLDIRGVKARIQVVEKILPKTDISGPCHIVATRDGVIEEVLALDGQANVKPGDVVKKGDILISGVVFPEKSPYIVNNDEEEKEEEQEEPYTVRARGQVKARVWHEGYGECRLHEEKLVLSGRKLRKIYIETPWKTFLVKGQREKTYNLYEQKIKKRIVKSPLGDFGFFQVELKEKIKKTRDFTEKEAVKLAQERAMKTLARKMGDNTKISESRVDILSRPSDPILRARISVEAIEDIATTQPINISPNSN
ncbi:MAG: sporulation protein YqfD [Syntrophomonadaceae bacterium]|jgi:similar to stage IV sporulation protein|nr:sporulation protein YqfD [Syntrophomonadaceae bacterium]